MSVWKSRIYIKDYAQLQYQESGSSQILSHILGLINIQDVPTD